MFTFVPMQPLNLPDYSAHISINAQKRTVFDPIRKTHVALTPEEWVRQNIVQHLVLSLGYPLGLLATEQQIEVNGTKKRCDIVVYNRNAQPLMIVECKATSVSITQKTFDQIAVYNIRLGVRYLLVTNGLTHYCCKVDNENKQLVFLETIPTFGELE